jgi:uncharacterized protein
LQFEWDVEKAQENHRKHGVSFDEATTVFGDPLAATGRDPDPSVDEERFVTLGISSAGRLLIVSNAERGDTIRIISARLMNKAEIAIYEEGQP